EAFVFAGDHSASRGRRHGRPATGVPGWRFLAYAQNHDQVGNRARGDRLSQLVRPDRLKIAAALVVCAPFVPMFFQGEEWGATTPFQYFTDHPDPDLGRAISEGRRREFAAFGWDPADVPDPQDPATFERSKLDWDEASTGPHRHLYDWHRQLIDLRRHRADLAVGDRDRVEVTCDDAAGWLVLRRGSVAVACNLGPRPATVSVPGCRILLASGADVSLTGSTLVLPPDTVAIIGGEGEGG
ncbi:MAG: maltooligosyltrehalose trehalohydrolase, partial [Actinomycetota bacterium]|nr:maltooligosyltrehalose trehalohydrolase [Actinomycetota bacterium]